MATETLSQETISLIHLNLIPGVGLKTVQVLREVFGSMERALRARPDELRKSGRLSPAICDLLTHKPVQYPIEREIELIRKFGCQVITLDDAAYPAYLKEIPDSPVILYVRGEFTPEDAFSVSIVGSRNAKEYGQKVSYRLGYQLAQRNMTVVSGLAKGVDAAAHRGALEAGGRTIAVLGNGLSLIYPAVNADLASKVEASGALVSEFPMETKPKAGNFPRRNRIISGLTLGTVVVEASNRSGALITARLAGEQGREVFAVPGEIFSEHSAGTHALIDKGAKLISTVDDLINELPRHVLDQMPSTPPASQQPDVEMVPPQVPSIDQKSQNTESTSPPPAPKVPPPDLTPDERTIFDAIQVPSSHIDTIVRTTQLPISKVSSVLLILELKGVVQQLPGKQFAVSTQ